MSAVPQAAVTLRAPTAEDIADLARFFAAMQAEQGGVVTGSAELRHRLASPLHDPEADFRIAFGRGGEIVGWGDLWDENGAHERLFGDVKVHPRDPAVYAVLLDWLGARAGAVAAERRTGQQAVLKMGAPGDDETLRRELDGRGFRLVRHFLVMEADLADEGMRDPELPVGIVVRTFRPDDERAVYEACNDAFADHWDFSPIDLEQWEQFFFRAPDFDPTLQFLAMDGDEIAGIALCRPERRPNTGNVSLLGVRPRWRRRGLGLALLLCAFAEFRRRGVPKVDLGVDSDSTTDAVRLYERAGMRVVRRNAVYERSLG